MSKSQARMAGILMMMLSVFLIIGGLFLKDSGIPGYVAVLSLVAGLALLTVGTIFYKFLKSE